MVLFVLLYERGMLVMHVLLTQAHVCDRVILVCLHVCKYVHYTYNHLEK